MLLAVLTMGSCSQEDLTGGPEAKVELMSFAFKDKAPVIAAPDEEVFYSFTVSYVNGLSSVAASLDGEVIDGSMMTWDDAPTAADYLFKYVVKGSQFGQTLDFVFTATGVDGYVQKIDYPLWVSANEVEFTIALPENLPHEIYSNEQVACEVNITSGNVLKSFTVLKDNEEFYSKADFTDTDKTFRYQFEYVPVLDDVNKDIEFHFVATDVKGNEAEAYYSVKINKADIVLKELYSEIFNTSMSISGTTAFNTVEGGITGGRATEFIPSNIGRYNSMFMQDPEAEEGVMMPRPGAMEGCKVYDGDVSALVYTTDGTEVCLSKNGGSGLPEAGTYLWYRRGVKSGDSNYNQGKGWLRVDGIKLHGATSLKLSYKQLTSNSKIKVEYSIDNGVTWVEVIATSVIGTPHEAKFVIEPGAETISLKLSENSGTAHACVDDIKLVEIF